MRTLKNRLLAVIFGLAIYSLGPNQNIFAESVSNTAHQKIEDEAKAFYKKLSPYSVFLQGDGFCSGVIIGKDLILTCKHCLTPSRRLLVILKDNDDDPYNNPTVTARLLVTHSSVDLALFQVEDEGLTKLVKAGKFPDLEPLKVNPILEDIVATRVIQIGCPGAFDRTWSYSEGYVTGFEDDEDGAYLRIAIDTLPGNSGSCVFNTKGELIGITSKLVGGSRFTLVVPAKFFYKNISAEKLSVPKKATEKQQEEESPKDTEGEEDAETLKAPPVMKEEVLDPCDENIFCE
jgi:S1-C subfamily serine protease